MKVIELLNKIANGEEVPRKIKFNDEILEFKFRSSTIEELYNNWNGYWLGICNVNLNDEVEIIEEDKKEDNKIEKLDTWFGIKPVNGDSPTTFKENAKYIDHNTEMFFEKINEIIDKVNKLGE